MYAIKLQQQITKENDTEPTALIENTRYITHTKNTKYRR